VSLDILDVVQLGCERVLNVDDDDLPVRLTFIEKGHDTEDLDLLDLTYVANLLADFADIERVVVTLGFSLCMGVSRIFPSLCDTRLRHYRSDLLNVFVLEGKLHSSRCIRGGESSYERI